MSQVQPLPFASVMKFDEGSWEGYSLPLSKRLLVKSGLFSFDLPESKPLFLFFFFSKTKMDFSMHGRGE